MALPQFPLMLSGLHTPRFLLPPSAPPGAHTGSSVLARKLVKQLASVLKGLEADVESCPDRLRSRDAIRRCPGAVPVWCRFRPVLVRGDARSVLGGGFVYVCIFTHLNHQPLFLSQSGCQRVLKRLSTCDLFWMGRRSGEGVDPNITKSISRQGQVCLIHLGVGTRTVRHNCEDGWDPDTPDTVHLDPPVRMGRNPLEKGLC